MDVSGVAAPFFGSVAGAVTDARGRAAVRVRLGTRAGDAWVAVLVPLFNLQDTAHYTVLPGAATRVQLSPRDTTLALGASFTYRGSTADRAGNPRPDPVTFEGSGAALTVESTGKVTAAAIGPARVRVRALIGGMMHTDSATAMVVPQARVATSAGTSQAPLRISDLSGANLIGVDDNGLAASWEPGNARYVYVRGDVLVIGNVGGNSAVLATPGVGNPTWPEWSSDGQWIYFHGDAASGVHVYRIRPDGTGITNLTPGTNAAMPSPSPDGRRMVYVGANGIVLHDLETGVTQRIANTTIRPGTALVTGRPVDRLHTPGLWQSRASASRR
jgi:hypothetical protein